MKGIFQWSGILRLKRFPMAKKIYNDSELVGLRTGGIIKQKQKDYFILRTRVPGGYLEAEIGRAHV